MRKFYQPVYSSEGRISGLDLMRCIAIFLVLVDHVLIFFPDFAGKVVRREYSGTLGGELFLVLSGFLIGTILLKVFLANERFGGNARVAFSSRRWLRTLPAFIFYLTLYVLISFLTRYEEFGGGVSWNLAIEEWFYLLLPVWIGIITYWIKSNKKKLFLFCILGFITIVFAIRIIIYYLIASGKLPDLAQSSGIENFQDRLYLGIQKIIVLRFDAGSFGVVVACVYFFHKDWLVKSRNYLFVGGAILSGVAGALYYQVTSLHFGFLPFVFAFPLFGIGISLMLPFIINISVAAFSHSLVVIVQYISIISYSIYLSHTIYQNVFLHVQDNINYSSAILLTLLMLVCTYFTSILPYNCLKGKGMMLRKAEQIRTIV